MSEQFGKFGVISDEALSAALRHHSAEDIDVRRMAEELTVRRAADLNDDDKEALEYLRFFADELHKQDGLERAHYAVADRALAVLNRLLERNQ